MADKEQAQMNQKVWHKIFKDYIKSSESIKHLHKQGILDDEDMCGATIKLLDEIIETFRGEVEE